MENKDLSEIFVPVERKDIPKLHELIRQLAIYEKKEENFTTTVDDVEKNQKKALHRNKKVYPNKSASLSKSILARSSINQTKIGLKLSHSLPRTQLPNKDHFRYWG